MNAKAKIQAQLSAYLDGELDEAQLRQVEEALENDGNLRAELADLAAARRLLRDLPAEKPPLDLVSRVLAEAERSQLVSGHTTESSSDAMRWIRYTASAAVLLVAATVGMVIAFTLCSPDMYRDNLSRREKPPGTIRDDKTTVAVASGKRTDVDEDADKDGLGRLATRGLLTNGTAGDGRELKERGVDLADRAGTGGHGIDGKLGTLDDNERSSRSGPGGPEVPGGKYGGNTTFNNGALATGVIASKGGSGDLAKGKLNDNNDEAAWGRFRNVDSMSGVLAGDMTNNTIIYTDRLDQTQQQVEKVLGANGIAPIVTKQSEQPVVAKGHQSSRARGNFYVSNTLSPAQVQYEAYVTPEQLAKVQKDLDSLRARQNVSQDVPALAYNGSSAKDGGWNYKKDQAGKGGDVAGKESDKWAGVALARSDGDSGLRRKVEAESKTPAAKVTPPPARAAKPAPTPPPATPAAKLAPAAKPVATRAPVTPSAEAAPPAPVVVAPGRGSGVKEVEKAKQDVQPAAKDKAQPAKAPESGSAAAAEPRGQSANEPLDLGIGTETRREVAQTRPATPAEKIASGERPSAPGPSVAATPAETPAPNQAAKTRDMAQSDVQLSTRPAKRLAGQVVGPIGGQCLAGTPNPPTAPPAAQTQAPATTRQEEQVVQVGIVRQPPLTQSGGGTVAVQIASQPSQGRRINQVEQNLATAIVQKLVITLNYRQAGEAGSNLDLDRAAKLSAAATTQAAPAQAAPAANKAAQQESQTQSK